ncbi:uncharacterized protein TNCV_924661 [Trichonephila clavipes]|nr:uncharacterized protein TNCV_924661 [Trichonephila clavipes]
MIRRVQKVAELDIDWELRPRDQNAVTDVLSRNTAESIIWEKVNCAVIRDLVLLSREQLIEEQRKDLESGRKLITPFQKLVTVSDGTQFPVWNIESLFDEARQNTRAKHEKWVKYYDRRMRDVQIKGARPTLWRNCYRVLEVKYNNLVIWRSGKRLTVNVDQVGIYSHRKSSEMEIRTGSSDSNSSRYKSSNFESVQRRSNELQYSKKKGCDVKRELDEKGISVKIDILHTSLTAQQHVDTILRPVALAFVVRHPGASFQQDNPKPHTASISLDCLCAVNTLP